MPDEPKIYHIVHIDRLPSIIADGGLWCDAEVARRGGAPGTTIGMDSIKQRRLTKSLNSHPDLRVGDCVPFYFCPRSVMLYNIYKPDRTGLEYRGGQDPIVHLEADLHQTVAWAGDHKRRWAFTTSNAGSRYFDDYSDLAQLDKVDWDAVQASGPRYRRQHKDGKQAEFLVEGSFPWELVSRIGVRPKALCAKVLGVLHSATHRPTVEWKPEWYHQ
jgi:hypothetical protein